jgi:hypothetical protein
VLVLCKPEAVSILLSLIALVSLACTAASYKRGGRKSLLPPAKELFSDKSLVGNKDLEF